MVEIKINNEIYQVQKGCKISDFVKEKAGLKMPCGGIGKCGKCKVFATGELNPLTETEKNHLTADEIKNNVRLACKLVAEGNCTINFAWQNENDVIITDGQMPEILLKPDFKNYGIAIDIGTTTIAARMYDVQGNIVAQSSCINSQTAWGADVISRIEADIAGNGKKLAESVRSDINKLICEMAKEADTSAQNADKLVITGNTVMLHLLTETCTKPLSCAPFKVERLFGETVTAKEIGITAVSESTEVYLPPCVSAFVGADVMTAFLASDIWKSEETHMLVDIGTNGEMALWHGGKLTVCSTAAGPAFEGVGISMGMSGKDGAIDRVTVENGHIKAHVIGDGKPVGICGSGIADAVACLLEMQLLDETGFLEDDPTEIADGVCVSGQDIRAVQLAKSAVHAGILTLLCDAGITCENLRSAVVAGGFGSRLNINSAVKIGLLPIGFLNKVKVIGNGALTGASILLLNRSYREICEKASRQAHSAELSLNPVFTEKYIENMMF